MKTRCSLHPLVVVSVAFYLLSLPGTRESSVELFKAPYLFCHVYVGGDLVSSVYYSH
jgi:hypothetical protein